MRFLISIISIAIFSFLAGLYLPWWSIAIIAFLISLLLPQHPAKGFLVGKHLHWKRLTDPA